MNDAYESVLMKARKLAALASGGVEGERENAQEALRRHLEKHGLRLEQLRTDDRRERTLPCFDARKKPVMNKDLVSLGVQCLSFVMNAKVQVQAGKMKFPWKGKRVWGGFVDAELTDLEWEDWVACFAHFMPDFLATQKKMKEALKQCLNGFIHQHGIFREKSADEEAGDSMMTPEQLEALIMAMRGAAGSKWKRPAGRLEQTGFMLTE